MIIEEVRLDDDGRFPNSRLPVLLYRDAVPGAAPGEESARRIEELFDRNGWGSSWRNGVFDFQHYHSTAHEALGVFAGTATVQLGGEGGKPCDLARGDVVVIPAGVAHKRLRASADFRVVGAYPGGQSPDMCYGRAGERPAADRRLSAVLLPGQDPVEGARGALGRLWQGSAT